MKKSYSILLFVSLILIGCGRTESGYIKNETGKTIIIRLGLNDVNNDPTKYLVGDALNRTASSNHEYDGIDNYFVSYDRLTNELTLKLEIDEQLKLGTVRLDMTRDSIKYWEFNSIKAKGDGVDIQAEGNEIMSLVERRRSLFSQNSHYLTEVSHPINTSVIR